MALLLVAHTWRLASTFSLKTDLDCRGPYINRARVWPDDVCEQILTNVKNAMERGYSKLLINENAIPDVEVHWETTALDMMMLALFASKERTSKQWKHLLKERAGLKIVKIWGGGDWVESLIE